MATDESQSWLPCVEAKFSRPISSSDFKQLRSQDQFFQMAFLLHRKERQPEALALARTHCFLQDHAIPGFTGRCSHIDGNKVISLVINTVKEMGPSRHPLYRNVTNAITHFDTCKKQGKTWQEALQMAKNNPKKKSPLAPLTPERLLAGCIIEYLNGKSEVKDGIGKMKMVWMIFSDQPAAGYWEGASLDDIELPDAEPDKMKFDYSKVLGDDYAACCRDISPYLPPWARSMPESGDIESHTPTSPRESTEPPDAIVVEPQTSAALSPQSAEPARHSPAAQATLSGFANRKSTKRPPIDPGSPRPSKYAKLDEAIRGDPFDMLKNLTAELKKEIERELGDIRRGQDTFMQEIRHAQQKAVETELLDAQKKTQKELANLTDRIIPLERALRPGTDGYLKAKCPPPAEWTERPEAWLAMVFRAGMAYIFEFGRDKLLPDGVEWDGETYATIMDRFKDLSESDVKHAVEHVHICAYGKPLPP